MRVSLYKIVIDIGVCGGHNHKVGIPQQSGGEGGFAFMRFAVIPELGDVRVVEGDRRPCFLQLLDDTQGGTLAVIVYICLYATPSTSTLEPFNALRWRLSILPQRSTVYSGMWSFIIMEASIIDVWKPYSRAFQVR